VPHSTNWGSTNWGFSKFDELGFDELGFDELGFDELRLHQINTFVLKAITPQTLHNYIGKYGLPINICNGMFSLKIYTAARFEPLFLNLRRIQYGEKRRDWISLTSSPFILFRDSHVCGRPRIMILSRSTYKLRWWSMLDETVGYTTRQDDL
jgi:hypothetical protein